jgi:hypothetical protein
MLVGYWFELVSDREPANTPSPDGAGKRELRKNRKKALTEPEALGTFRLPFVAGWSSLVARQAHNLKVAGSNPAPAPNLKPPESLPGVSWLIGYAFSKERLLAVQH